MSLLCIYIIDDIRLLLTEHLIQVRQIKGLLFFLLRIPLQLSQSEVKSSDALFSLILL